MGLMKKAEGKINTISLPAAQKRGLLHRITHSSPYDMFLEAFDSLCKGTGIERCAIICKSDDNQSRVLVSSGFDFTTISRLTFDPTVLDSYCTGSKVHEISIPANDSLHSCFSSREYDSLRAVYITTIDLFPSRPCWFLYADSLLNVHRIMPESLILHNALTMLCTQLVTHISLLEMCIPTTAINQSQDAYIERIRSSLSLDRTASYFWIDFSPLFPDLARMLSSIEQYRLYSIITHYLAKKIGSSHCIRVDAEYRMRVVLFTINPIDPDLYIPGLLVPLKKAFGTDRISMLGISTVSISKDFQDIAHFLFGES